MKVLLLSSSADDDWAASRLDTGALRDIGLDVVVRAPGHAEIEADILVLSPSVTDPLGHARSFRQRRPSGQILFVVPGERLERMRRMLPFSPEISGAWVLDAGVSAPEFLKLLTKAARDVATRRDVRGMYGRINARFAAVPTLDDDQARRIRHQALSERYLTAILVNAPDALVATDLEGEVVSWNEAAARLFRRSWDAVSGRSFADLVVPADRELAASLLGMVRMGESIRARELRIAGEDGKEATVEVAAGPILGGAGSIDGVSLVARDITARKRDEEALRQLNGDLEGRVAQAVAAREETAAALRQAQKMEAVGQLTGGVAHDFNNLLTVIKSSVDLLRRPNLAEDRRHRYVEAIADTVDRAAKLTGQLLAFARRQPLKPEVFDGTARIRSVTDMVGTIVGGRIAIRHEVPDQPCLVHADASQFDTAILNMAVNARDAMDGEGTLSITLRETAGIPSIRGHRGALGRFIAVSVTDTGVGIPASDFGQIFEPFFTTKGVGKGTGLGLSQVFGFAKQSGGDIEVQSEVDRGTTFTLYLPRIERAADDVTDADVRADVPLPDVGRRVLMVEDNVEVGKFATQILEDLGHTITWAPNAAEALDLLAADSERYDIVFSDVVMPGMNGIELGQAIRRCYPDLPVVLASGYSHVLAEEGRHGFELIQKPYAAGDVARVLNRLARA